MSQPHDAAGDPAQGRHRAKSRVGDEWAAVGLAIFALGVLANDRFVTPNSFSVPLLVLGGAIMLFAAVVGQFKPIRLTKLMGGDTRPTWLLPRLVVAAVALGVIVGTLVTLRASIEQPCPLAYDHEDAGELIHIRLHGDTMICTYEYTGMGGGL